MSYVAYNNLKTANQVIEKMAEYITSRGFTVVEALKDDLNVYDRSSVDGKKFVFMDKTNTYFIHLRSFEYVSPFGTTDDAAMDVATPDTHVGYQGVAMTISEGYSQTQRWYNQYLVPLNYRGNQVQFVCIPVVNRNENYEYTAQENPDTNENAYTLYCNNTTLPTDTLVFSLVAENVGGDQANGWDYRAVHLIVGMLNKYDDWEGGIFMSGSAVPSTIKQAYELFANSDADDPFHEIKDANILPVLSSGRISNTFLRIDIDDAPKESRGYIRWASSGTDNVTGKRLSMPVRDPYGGSSGNGKIPHYGYIQSQGKLDWGRNINTLNCITLNMPMFMAVQVDPDALNNYAGAGQVSGVYFVCMLNMQTSFCYEMSYPKSNDLCQVFSMSMRRGRFGFDGISIRQNEDDSDSTIGDITTTRKGIDG